MEKLEPLIIYLVRHAQTADNLSGRFAGWSDSPLTELGLRQVQATALRFRNVPLSAVYTSSSARALVMAEAVVEAVAATSTGIRLHTLPELRERHFGTWEGLSFPEAQNASPHAMQKWIDDPIEIAPPSGESILQCSERLETVADWLRLSANAKLCHDASLSATSALPTLNHLPLPTGRIAIVSHGAALRVLLALLLRLPLQTVLKLGCDHASVSGVELFGNDQVVLRSLNDTNHLTSAV